MGWLPHTFWQDKPKTKSSSKQTLVSQPKKTGNEYKNLLQNFTNQNAFCWRYFARTSRLLRIRVAVYFGFLLTLPLFSYTREAGPAFRSRVLGSAVTQLTRHLLSDNLNFQARLEGSSGAIAPDGYYNIRFKLDDALSGGTNLWTNLQLHFRFGSVSGPVGTNDCRVRVANGYVTVNLVSSPHSPQPFPCI